MSPNVPGAETEKPETRNKSLGGISKETRIHQSSKTKKINNTNKDLIPEKSITKNSEDAKALKNAQDENRSTSPETKASEKIEMKLEKLSPVEDEKSMLDKATESTTPRRMWKPGITTSDQPSQDEKITLIKMSEDSRNVPPLTTV